MRRALLLSWVLLTASLVACEGENTTATAPADARTAVIAVEGMSCASCVAGIRKSLSSMEGVYSVEVSLEHRTARVHFDEEEVSVEQIAEAIRALGYEATPSEGAQP